MGSTYESLLDEVGDWCDIWCGEGCRPEELAEALAVLEAAIKANPQELSHIDADDVEAASSAYKEYTCAPDGWHPKTFRLLSRPAREALARLLRAIEESGWWPESNSSIHMKVTPKPTGGNRLIGWYRALFRLWCTIRKDYWVQWESTHGSDNCFSASRGNNVIDVAWRQAARAEIAVNSRKFPLELLRLTLVSYGWLRNLVTADNIIAQGVIAWRGMVAGCVAAARELNSIHEGRAGNHDHQAPSSGDRCMDR